MITSSYRGSDICVRQTPGQMSPAPQSWAMCSFPPKPTSKLLCSPYWLNSAIVQEEKRRGTCSGKEKCDSYFEYYSRVFLSTLSNSTHLPSYYSQIELVVGHTIQKPVKLEEFPLYPASPQKEAVFNSPLHGSKVIHSGYVSFLAESDSESVQLSVSSLLLYPRPLPSSVDDPPNSP